MSVNLPVVQSRVMTGGVDLLRLHQAFPERYPALLASASGAANGHRYDFLFAGLVSVPIERLSALDVSRAAFDTGLPFIGGYFVFLPYDYAQQIEPSLHLPEQAGLTPHVWQVSAVFIWDHLTQTLSAVAQPEYRDWLSVLWQDWNGLAETSASPCMVEAQLVEDEGNRFLAGVERCKEYILAGDVFQVNLSRQWQADIAPDVTPANVFAQLRQANPAPFSSLLCWDGQAVVSSSPERLVRVRHGVVDTRPIAGTRRRGETVAQDDALMSELRLHPKEQAEHVMLLDLERNDLGRVCVPGSVRVDELMAIETYTHVHHIVSNVCGQLREGITAKQVIDAVFPGGTITGCPKIRCMEIIAELEQTARGVYTGSLGYVSLDGQMDVNILIRSFHWQAGQLTFRAGAGIVYDSVPESELEETRHKAKGLVRALDVVA
jgi:anthranilate synthase component 1